MHNDHNLAKERRTFLKGVAAAGGAAALVAASREAVSDETTTSQNSVEKAPSQGYRETPHVKDYYASLRI